MPLYTTYRNLGSAISSPSGVRDGDQAQIDFMHYLVWKWSLTATILTKNFRITLKSGGDSHYHI